jgi:hypothetical protein
MMLLQSNLVSGQLIQFLQVDQHYCLGKLSS